MLHLSECTPELCVAEPAPSIDGVYGKDWCMDLWRDEKLSLQRKETLEPGATTSMGPQVGFQSTLAFIYFIFF